MASIFATAASPPCLSQGNDPPSPPHQSVEGLVNWFSSELHLFLGTNNVRAPTVVSTQSHLGGITTLATTMAIIPFAGRVVPTAVFLSLVPLHLGTGQYPPSPPSLDSDQGGEFGSLPPSHLSGPSQPSMNYPIAAGDITIDPRYLECAPSQGGFPIAPLDSIPRPDVYNDYQPSRHDNPPPKPIQEGFAAVTALPRVAAYPPPFNQLAGAYVASGRPPSSSPINRGVIPPAHTAYQNEKSRRSTFQQLLGQTYQANTAEQQPIRGVRVNQHGSRHQCTMCDANYAQVSGLNRHYKDRHLPWIVCTLCGLEFSSGRAYLLTEHRETYHPGV